MNGALRDQLRALGTGVGVAVLVAMLTVVALGFLAAALYMALARLLDPALAALLTAAAALVAAGLIVLVAKARRSRPGPAAGSPGPAGIGGLGPAFAGGSPLGAELAAETAQIARAHAGKAVVVSLALGFALGVSPRLRRLLWRALR
jgi:hypothetical protein